MFGEDCMRASPRYIKKVAEQYKDNVEIPFAYRSNVSLALQQIQTDEPTASQAKELINYITRAIVDSHSKFEGNSCENTIPVAGQSGQVSVAKHDMYKALLDYFGSRHKKCVITLSCCFQLVNSLIVYSTYISSAEA